MRRALLRNRRWLAEVLEVLLVAAALAASFLLRFEFSLEAPYLRMLAAALPLAAAAKLAVFRTFGLRDLSWRYLGFQDLQRIAGASASASCLWALLTRFALGSGFPRSIYVIDLLTSTILLLGAHAAARMYFEARRSPAERARQRVAIYGAGQAGVTLLKEIRSNPQIGFEVKGFFDDDPMKRGLSVDGAKVLGDRGELARATARERIGMVLIALPAATGVEFTSILEACHRAGITAKRVPALAELIRNRVLVDQIRDVRIEDLLGRAPARLAEAETRDRLRDRVVLVTGAGGSIGGELCRQIARFSPRALVGFDHSETALYEIARQIEALFPALKFFPEVGSVQNRRRLDEVFRERSPEAVYHAAAYKHVPMMEAHLFEAVENNVFGTRNVIAKALEYGAEHMVLISSDKAVRPANVMGATKRIAEMICQAAAFSSAGSTRLLSVRFGNVLGSSGSVIPLFKEQIAAGGPVTVTHPDMRRYFMTIPEAAQLVLQAAAMGAGGEIFVLEMGEPVRILDLARKMVLLSGLQPGADIEITFSGVRPGEKLYEELSGYDEDTLSTPHSQIRVLSGAGMDAQALERGLDRLQAAVEASDAGKVLLSLKDLAPEYNPSSFLRRSLEETNSKHLAFAAAQAGVMAEPST